MIYFAHQLHEPLQKNLTYETRWQLFLALVIAVVAAGLTYYFTDRSKRKANLGFAKATLVKNVYLLQQVWSNRLQSELKAYYYEARKNLATNEEDRRFYGEVEKYEALAQPNLSIEVSRAYGDIIQEVRLTQSLSSKKSFKKVEKLVSELGLRHKKLYMKDIDTSKKSDLQEVVKYENEGHAAIEDILDKEIRKKLQKLEKELESVRLRWI